MSRDLNDLLRAYGRQIEQDLKALPERSGDPAGSPSDQLAERRTRRAHRSSWMLTAATIALIALVTSLLFPSALLEGSPMNRKATGWVLGLCLMAGCTSTVENSTPTIGSATPTSAPSTAPSPDVFDGVGMVEPGRYRVNRFGTPIELTVPKFWYRFASFALSGDGDSFVAFFDIAQVPTDACKWEQSKTAIGPTVQDLVTALTTQQNTVATTPEPRDLDGHPGVYLEVRQPAGLDLQNCDLQYAVGWFDRIGNEVPTVGSDGFNAIWAVDLGDGQRVVITWGSYQPLSDKQRAVVQSIVDSLTIP
jgi:hypothetical protein